MIAPTLTAPVLSVADPAESGETSIDPLSLQAFNESLAERIYPHMTVRMSRPRFVTALAVGARVCDGLEDEVASDGITPAWLVFEWYVVEAIVRERNRLPPSSLLSVPGRLKVEGALDKGTRLSAGTYLKTPKVFGFTGVYKRLALGLRIVAEDLMLEEGGFELLRLWQEEQELHGFLDGREGTGAKFRGDLRVAVEEGLRNGHTARGERSPLWRQIVLHLEPGTPGPRERRWIWERLLRPDLRLNRRDPEAATISRELMNHLEHQGRPITTRLEETAFLRGTISAGSAGLRERLVAVDAFEALCRPIEDALRLILYLSTERGSAPVSEDDFGALPLAVGLAGQIAPAVQRLITAFGGNIWDRDVQLLVERYQGVADARSLFEAVLAHHEEAQRVKLPDGKRPWVERTEDGRVVVRPQNRQKKAPMGADEYVRFYRTTTASQFLQDLGKLAR